MTVILARSAYSTNIKTRKDFSCALLDKDARVLAQAFAQPTHLGSLVRLVPRAIEGRRLRRGDTLVINDPYRGATHLNDVCVIRPVYLGRRHFGYVANLAHWVDIGGAAPASLPLSREIFQEGLIIPPILVQEDGRTNQSAFDLILANVRAKKEVAGDFRAQMAANQSAEENLEKLALRYGVRDLHTYSDALLDYTERMTAEAFADFPPGVWHGEDCLDDDGWGHGPLPIHVAVKCDDRRVEVDFAGTAPQGRSPVNATLTFTFSAVAFVLKCILPNEIEANDGFYRRISISAPENSIVNAASPAGVVGGWEVSQRIAGAMFRALAEPFRDRVPAASKGIIGNLGFGGFDTEAGRYFAYYETIAGGAGGARGMDGEDGVQADMTNTENAPVEEVEMHQPVRIQRYGLVPDSGGAGQWRGGLGVIREYRFLKPGITFSLMADRTLTRPWGLAGGADAQPASYKLNGETIPSKGQVQVGVGDVVTVQTPGGGGWGDPSLRSRAALLEDVATGKVSRATAIAMYGVNPDEP